MPTSHGSLAFNGRGPVADRLDPRGPPAGRRRGAGRQDGRPRVRHAQLHQDQGLGHHPQPVGPRAHARRLERGQRRGGGRRAGPGGDRQRRRRLDPHPGRRSAASSGSSPATAASRTPGPTGSQTVGVRAAHHHRGRQRPPPRRRRRARRPRPLLAARGRPSATSRPSSRSPSTGLRARWSRRPRLRPLRPRGPGASPRRRPASSPTPRAWCSTTSPSCSPTRCARGCAAGRSTCGCRLEPGMWPAVADDLTRYSRSVLEQTERLPGAQGGRVDPPARAARRSTRPGCSPRSTCCSRRPTAVPAFAAEGPPPDGSTASRPGRSARRPRRSRCWPTCAGTRRSRCRPGARSTACRSGCRSWPPATATSCPLRLAAHLGADPPLAPPRPDPAAG